MNLGLKVVYCNHFPFQRFYKHSCTYHHMLLRNWRIRRQSLRTRVPSPLLVCSAQKKKKTCLSSLPLKCTALMSPRSIPTNDSTRVTRVCCEPSEFPYKPMRSAFPTNQPMRSGDVTYCLAFTRAIEKCSTRGYARANESRALRHLFCTFSEFNMSHILGLYIYECILIPRALLYVVYCTQCVRHAILWRPVILEENVRLFVANSVVDISCQIFGCPSHVPLYLLSSSSSRPCRAYMCWSKQAGGIAWHSGAECVCLSFLCCIYMIRLCILKRLQFLWFLKLVRTTVHKVLQLHVFC